MKDRGEEEHIKWNIIWVWETQQWGGKQAAGGQAVRGSIRYMNMIHDMCVGTLTMKRFCRKNEETIINYHSVKTSSRSTHYCIVS